MVGWFVCLFVRLLVGLVVGPRLADARGVFVESWSFCFGFYSTLSVSPRAYGSFPPFYLFLVLLNQTAWILKVFIFFGRGLGGLITSLRLRCI